MSMNVLITGRGTSGSWKIRGIQLGEAIGATVQARTYDFEQYDRVVVVKRIDATTLKDLKRRDKPWIWDVVDAWPQKDPNGNTWNAEEAIRWLKREIRRTGPSAIVFPTTHMQVDSEFDGPALVLPHHAWPKYNRPNPIRQVVSTVGYEGGAQYLGKWHALIDAQCKKRGWHFSINGDMTYADIGIAVRDTRGYAPINWKSNCKLANIQALGIPVLCTTEASYMEFGSGVEFFVTTDNIDHAFERLISHEMRTGIGKQMLASAPLIDDVAAVYKTWLEQLSF